MFERRDVSFDHNLRRLRWVQWRTPPTHPERFTRIAYCDEGAAAMITSPHVLLRSRHLRKPSCFSPTSELATSPRPQRRAR